MQSEESDEATTIAAQAARLEAALERIAVLASRQASDTGIQYEAATQAAPGVDISGLAQRLDSMIARLRHELGETPSADT